MLDLWLNQMAHLSAGQAALIFTLSVVGVGLAILLYRMEDETDV